MAAKSSCRYQKCYCEENSVLLCEQLVSNHGVEPDQLFVVFISNPLKQVPLWYQSASEDGLVIWDYHVLVIQAAGGSTGCCMVWDLDTRLPFPCPLSTYVQCALQGQLRPEYQRLCRVVPYRLAQQYFGSDRSHMVKPDGTWSAPPPPWPCLQPLHPTSTSAVAAAAAADGTPAEGQDLQQGQHHNAGNLFHNLSTYTTMAGPTVTPQQLQQLRGSQGVAHTLDGLEVLWGCFGQVVAQEGLVELFGGGEAAAEWTAEEQDLVPEAEAAMAL